LRRRTATKVGVAWIPASGDARTEQCEYGGDEHAHVHAFGEGAAQAVEQ
jgi:hypothetical protein